jgi:hypothetical protein
MKGVKVFFVLVVSAASFWAMHQQNGQIDALVQQIAVKVPAFVV